MGNASVHLFIGQSLADEIECAAWAAVARCRLGDGRLYCPSRQAGMQGWWGVVVYSGLTLLRLGHAVAVCANMVSNDRDVMALLREKGAQLYLGDDMHTTHFINRIEGDDRQQEIPIAARPIGQTDLQKAVGPSDYILLGPLHPHDVAEEALAWLVAQVNTILCADLQGHVRRVEGGLVRAKVSASVEVILQAAQWVRVSQDELGLLLAWAQCDVGQLIERYVLREVVVTRG